MIDYNLISKEINLDNSCNSIYSLVIAQCDKIKGKNNIDLFFDKLNKILNAETLNRFYAVCFIASYYQQGKFKFTNFKKSYFEINHNSLDENIIDFFNDVIKKSDISFLNYCKQFEEFPWFLKINTNKLISDLILDSFFIQNEKSLNKKIEIINRIKKDDFVMDINYINNKLRFKEIEKIKYWQKKENPYLSTSGLVTKLIINNKNILASLEDATIWNYMKKVSGYLIAPSKKDYSFYYVGLDNIQYNKIMPFLKSFLVNEFIKKHMGEYLIQKIEKAEINKNIWRLCLITLALEPKENIKNIKVNKI